MRGSVGDGWAALRRGAVRFVEWPWFDRVILAIIIVNCAMLAIEGPTGHPDSALHHAFGTLSFAFQIIFTAEMAVKMLAYGLFAPVRGYMREPWNLLDLFIVVMGWLQYIIPGARNLSAVRSVRALRPLRTIKRMPGVRSLVDTMVAAAPGIADVAQLCAFFFALAALFGMALFGGTLRYRCVSAGAGATADAEELDVRVCRQHEMPASIDAGCPEGLACTDVSDPEHEALGFDDFGRATMTVFVLVTLEGWAALMYEQVDAVGWPALVYFLLVVLFGALLVLNLVRAVIIDRFVAPEAQAASTMDEIADSYAVRKLMSSIHHLGSSAARRARAHDVITSRAFNAIVLSATLLNTLTLACYHYGMEKALEDRLELVNFALSFVFFVEMALKLYALGVREYVRDGFNTFDGLIVISSCIEIALTLAGVDMLNVSQLRALRLFRVLKLAKASEGMRRVLSMMLSSLYELNALLVLMALVLYVFAALGMALFGLGFTPEAGFAEVPRTNFDDIAHSLLTAFVALSGEDWPDIYSACFQLSQLAATLFFIALHVVCNYVLLNLIIAILLSNIDIDDEEEDEDEDGEHEREHELKREEAGVRGANDGAHGGGAAVAGATGGEVAAGGVAVAAAPVTKTQSRGSNDGSARHAKQPTKAATRKLLMAKTRREHGQQALGSRQRSEAGGAVERGLLVRTRDYACGCLPPENPVRAATLVVVRSRAFNWVVVLVIGVASLSMAVEPLTPEQVAARPWMVEATRWTDLGVTAFFVAELMLKVLAFGLLWPAPTAYLRDPWNQLDLLIVSASVLSLCRIEGLEWLAAAMCLRALRPLRLVSQHGGMRVVVNALLHTLPSVWSVIVIFGLFILVFAILGVQLFGGTFAACTDPSARTEAECVGEFVDASGALAPREWANPSFGHFDSVPAASLLLFELTGLEGWPNVMFHAVDATPPGLAPERDHNIGAALFFVAWVLVGACFLANLFVGVIVDTFSELKRMEEGLLFMTAEQRQWVRMQEVMLRSAAQQHAERPSNSKWRGRLYDVVASVHFERAMMATIVTAAVVTACNGYDRPRWLGRAPEIVSIAATMLFALEALLKVGAFGWTKYISYAWNRFDFAIVLAGVFDYMLMLFDLPFPVPGGLIRALRLLRLLRILRASRWARGVLVLVRALLLTLPSLGNVIVLVLVLLFIFAVLGTHLFARVTEGEVIDEHVNFGSLGAAMLTLFQCATGDEWNSIMHDLVNGGGCAAARHEAGAPAGAHGAPAQGCSTGAAVPYFIAFTITSTFIAMNIIIAIVIDNFSDAENEQLKRDEMVTTDHIEAFREAWAQLDPEADNMISVRWLDELIRMAPQPLGLAGRADAGRHAVFFAFLRELDTLRAYSSSSAGVVVTFHDTLDALVNRAFPSASELTQEDMSTTRLAEVRQKKAQKQRTLLTRTLSVERPGRGGAAAQVDDALAMRQLDAPIAEVYAALRLQRHYRERTPRRRDQRNTWSRMSFSPSRKASVSFHKLRNKVRASVHEPAALSAGRKKLRLKLRRPKLPLCSWPRQPPRVADADGRGGQPRAGGAHGPHTMH